MTPAASHWVTDHLDLIPAGGHVLDVACGGGRHLRALLAAGFEVTGIDRDLSACSDIQNSSCHLLQADLESDEGMPRLPQFHGIVVTNYLHRPILQKLTEYMRPAGILIYETFMVGNEQYGRPSNPDFLLQPGELKQVFIPLLEMMDFREGEVSLPKQAVTQSIVCRKPD